MALSLSLFLFSSPRASSPQIKLSFQAAGTAPEYPSSQLTCDGGVVYWARHRHALPRTLGRPSKHRDNILSTKSSKLLGDARYCSPSNRSKPIRIHDNRLFSKTDRNVSRDHGQWQHQCFPGCLRFGFTPLSLNHLSLSLPRNEENDLFDGRE